MPARLKALDKELEFVLEDFNLIGRSNDATIRVTDGGVSRQHATIRRDGNLFWLADLGSANGSYVNDVAISTARALRHGDRIQLGTLNFLFDHDESEGEGKKSSSSTQVFNTIALPVKKLRATLLVGDLRNFTSISAKLSADQVADMLREWYADCERILKSRGAIIDKFIGDGVFAYWGTTDDETRRRATEAAMLLSSPEASNSPTRKMLRDEKDLEVHCHVGMNIGEVALGAMGRGVNTAVGEAVNVTFRIESLTRKLKQPVLVSEAFLAGWDGAEENYAPAGTHEVKGQPEPVTVFALKESSGGGVIIE